MNGQLGPIPDDLWAVGPCADVEAVIELCSEFSGKKFIVTQRPSDLHGHTGDIFKVEREVAVIPEAIDLTECEMQE